MAAPASHPLESEVVPPAQPRVLPLHPRLRTVMRLRALVVAVVLGVAASVLASAVLDLGGFASAGFVLAAILGAAVLLDAHARAAYARYRVTRVIDGVQVERGVIWKSLVFVPDIRIQHTEVNQGPFDRRWGMARLSIYTAATHYGAVSAPGLFHADALALRDELIGRSGVDVV
jgi:membrane protein YdbS with pleckstrin-like domain